jgi:hypothetical protein
MVDPYMWVATVGLGDGMEYSGDVLNILGGFQPIREVNVSRELKSGTRTNTPRKWNASNCSSYRTTIYLGRILGFRRGYNGIRPLVRKGR